MTSMSPTVIQVSFKKLCSLKTKTEDHKRNERNEPTYMKLKAKITVFIRRIKQKMTCLNFMADWREEVQTVFYD